MPVHECDAPEILISPPPLLEVRGLRHAYPGGREALSEVDLAVGEGEKVALVGANGSGKSTLLAHLAGCFAPQGGEILLEGRSVLEDLDRLRRSVGLIFQEPDDQLFMPTVLEDVAFGPVSRETPLAEAHERARAILESLGVGRLADRAPHRLSGGEKRMAALAGVLATGARIVALDEPSAALDPRSRRRVVEVLRSLPAALVVATHDLPLALEVCSRAVILNGGRVAASGGLPELFEDERLLDENALLG